MKKKILLSALCMVSTFSMFAQKQLSEVPEFSTYTNANNPVKSGGNNLLQGAEFKQWISNSSWGELTGGPYATYDGNNFTTGKIVYTVPQGCGNAQWMAQLSFTTKYAMEAGKKYDFTFHVKSTGVNTPFTVKLEDVDSGDTSAYDAFVVLPKDEEVLFVLKDLTPAKTIPTLRVVFDAGGAEVGSTLQIYDIILQSSDDLGQAGTGNETLAGPPEGFKLVWSDEFDNASSLTEKWNPMNWNSGHVNNERQNYRPGNMEITAADGSTMNTAVVKDGKLVINLFKGKDGKIYSARMDSKDAGGDHSDYAAWRYGYMEARIKLPSGKGTWPAFWMMPEGVNWTDETWPTCGEIDIMEEVGNSPNNCVSSLHAIGHYHANNTQVSASRHIDNMEGGWVTYSMLWDNDNISMYADGKQILSYNNDHKGYINWPYDRPYYITLNLAWGGDWGGAGGVDESVLPIDMQVDYVRVYQREDADMNQDGSGVVYICGPYNGIAKDGIVPSSTFNSWVDNYIPLKDDNKVYSHKFVVGKNLHPDRVDFVFSATPDRREGTVFTPVSSKYKLTLEDNEFFEISNDGHIKIKKGAKLGNKDEITLTFDCSRGTDNAVLKVGFKKAEPLKAPEGIWILGSEKSICPGKIDGNSDNWVETNAYKLTNNGDDTYSYDFKLGENLSRNYVNFKFFCQEGTKNSEGVEVAFVAKNGDYLIHSRSPYLGIGTGSNGHDNGNVYLKRAFPEDIREFTIKIDCTGGYDNAELTTSIDDILPPAPDKTYYIIGALNSICPDYLNTENSEWNWGTYYITLDRNPENGYLHSHTFTVGKDLHPTNVNFKFMPQNNWNGGQFGSNNQWAGYTVSHTGNWFALGDGNNGHDNGNVYLKDGLSLARFDKITVTLDVSAGEDAAVFYSDIDKLEAGVEEVVIEKYNDGRWYDLSGRILDIPSEPGLYIHNGKKVIVK